VADDGCVDVRTQRERFRGRGGSNNGGTGNTKEPEEAEKVDRSWGKGWATVERCRKGKLRKGPGKAPKRRSRMPLNWEGFLSQDGKNRSPY
jgi:hypothetical protein